MTSVRYVFDIFAILTGLKFCFDLSSCATVRRCHLQVRLNGSGRSYSATVKEVSADNGPVTVLIEELGKK